jgi:iron complex outermembrane receptor protein
MTYVRAAKVRHRDRRRFLAAGLWVAVVPHVGHAQSPEGADQGIQEVTVTAERRETTLSRVPVSVGVIGASELDRRGLTQLSDIVGTVAGVSISNAYGNLPQAVGIRGVGVSLPAMSQAVGIYVDDVALVRGYATALWDLPDIERIEVLRGPQGTLYGENSTAGAIKIVSIDPSTDAQQWASGSVGNYGAREAHAYLSGPLSDRFAASLAFSHRQNDGWAWNDTLHKHVNKLNATQFRVKLALIGDANRRVVLAVDGLQDRSDTNAANMPLNHEQARPRVLFTATDTGQFERNAGGASLKVEQRLTGNLKLRSITAVRGYRDDPMVGDFGGLELQRYALDQTTDQRALSQEIQLQDDTARLRWTAGAIVAKDRFEFHRYTAAIPVATNQPTNSEAQTFQETTNFGLYGQARYALDDLTGLVLGARGWHTRQTAANAFWKTDAERNRTSTVYNADGLSETRSGLLPRIALERQQAPGLFLYGSAAKGAKFGGFNRAAESQLSAETVTNPERVTTYELGAKGRSSRGLFTANVAAFYNDYRDYLAALQNTTINGVLVTDAVLVNAGKAQTFGLDLEVAAKLGDQTDLTASAEVLRTRFLEFANPTGNATTNYVGNELPYAPRFTLGSSLVHRVSLPDGSSLTLDTSLQVVGKEFTDVANNTATRVPIQTYFNAGATWHLNPSQWQLSMRVKNVFDKNYVLLRTRIPSVGVDAAYYDAPRTLMFTARHDF